MCKTLISTLIFCAFCAFHSCRKSSSIPESTSIKVSVKESSLRSGINYDGIINHNRYRKYTEGAEYPYIPISKLNLQGKTLKDVVKKYGNPSMSDEQMIEAAQIAQATEFIESKPEKYQEPIAQGGSNVSGGQKQRLSIARAIAIDPEILVFDDSFSALDFKTDSILRAELAKKTKDKTVIIVAQRINTILNADQIIVLEDGKVVGKGTHEELIKNNETYKQIALSQLSAEELNIEGGKEHE